MKRLSHSKCCAGLLSVVGAFVLAAAAQAQTYKYNYTGSALSFVQDQSSGTSCPMSVGNVTLVFTPSANTGTCSVNGYSEPINNVGPWQVNPQTQAVTNSMLQCNAPPPADGSCTITIFGGGCYGVHAIQSQFIASPASGFDQFVLVIPPSSGSGQATCVYQSNVPGTWSGPTFALSAKMWGDDCTSMEPEDQPSSPADPAVTSVSGSLLTPIPNTSCGNPINVANGNKFQVEVDFTGAASTGLNFTRYYNSQDTTSSPIGARWRSEWFRNLSVSGSTVTVTRSDGRQDVFTLSNGVYTADPDVESVLAAVLTNGMITSYKLTTVFDSIETYSPSGQLLSVTSRAGLTTALAYNAANQLTKVTGPFGHTLAFTYAIAPDGNPRLATLAVPDGGVYSYAYDAFGNLLSVTHPDNSVRHYVYENSNYPNFLTGVVDEDGNRFSTWNYDASGRAVSSQHAGGADLTSVAYGANSATVTDARGNSYSYNFTTLFNVVKPVSLSGAPVQIAGGRAFTYDANGFLASLTDWNGNVTTYANDKRGNQVARTLGYGTTQATSVTTAWLSNFHLPTTVTQQSLVTSFTYDAKGNLLTKTLAAPNTPTSTWTYTYNAFGQALSAKDPRGAVTTYTYDAKGNLASIVNPLGQVTNITSYDANGRPLSIQSPNGLVTTLTYNFRSQVTSKTEASWITTFAYDPAGQLIKLTRPDGSFLTFTYDAAHRVTKVTDTLGNYITYAYDPTSNITTVQVLNAANILKSTHSYAYDLVNRVSQSIGALSQTTSFAYDQNSNLTAVTDPLGNQTTALYNSLNRQIQETDPLGGITSFIYDLKSRLIGVQDPRGLTTAYSYDGLDDVAAMTSPDSGASS